MRLYLVSERNETETPLFCSENQKDVADFLHYSRNGLYSRLYKARLNGGKVVVHNRLVHIVDIPDSEYKEIIDEEA